MKALWILAAVLTVALFCAFLRHWRPEQALAVSLAASACLLAAAAAWLAPVLEQTERWFAATGLPSEHLSVLYKGIGITLLTELAADTCLDAGQTALAAKAQLVGRVCLLLLSVPLLQSVSNVAFSLLQEGTG